MSKDRSIDKIEKNKDNATTLTKQFLDDTFEKNPDKADKLSYWFREYINLLKFEKIFSPERLKKYKRGDIIKVNFGFRLGAELGGLHYCVVINNNNSIKAPLITVVPLISLKWGTEISKLPPDRIFLGYEISDKVGDKCMKLYNELDKELDDLASKLETRTISEDEYNKRRDMFDNKYAITRKIHKEFLKMKCGSVALIGQITTISKLRIFDPKSHDGVLSGIRISNEMLNEIDSRIRELYTYSH